MTENEDIKRFRRCTFNLPRSLYTYLKNRAFHEETLMTRLVAQAVEEDKKKYEARLLKKEKAEKSF